MKNTVVFKGEDTEQHLVFAEVYAPDRPDAHGDFMRAEEIQKAAHDFVKNGRMGQIDVMHDNNVLKSCSVVESFIAREDDPLFIPGSWVVGVYVGDEAVWDQIKKGEINGFSMEALVNRRVVEVELDVPPIARGVTTKTEDHSHDFYVSYDEDGNFRGGVTSFANGHYHRIIRGTHTEEAEGHNHRFISCEGVTISGGVSG